MFEWASADSVVATDDRSFLDCGKHDLSDREAEEHLPDDPQLPYLDVLFFITVSELICIVFDFISHPVQL
jgi:hypothetical protein